MKENILAQSAWWTINKAMTMKLGIEASLLLSDLIWQYEKFKLAGTLQKDDSFFNTRETIEKNTTLSIHKQRMALAVLKEENLIESYTKGIPPKAYYKLNLKNINDLVNSLHS